MLMCPNKDETAVHDIAPVTSIVVTRVKQVVSMRVNSGQTMELSSGGLCFLPFYQHQALSVYVI